MRSRAYRLRADASLARSVACSCGWHEVIEHAQRLDRTDRRRGYGSRRSLRAIALATVVRHCCVAAPAVQADSRAQARRIHDRLAGVPPTAAVLDDMAADVAAGRAVDAAYTAMENRSFYDVTLKNFATPWTNREQTVFAPLNDYVATVIGMVRDDVPFNSCSRTDILYIGSGAGLPAYSPSNNDHYAALESSGVDLKTPLVAHDAVGRVRHPGRRDGRRDDDASGRRRRSSSPAPTARCSASRC